MLDLGPKARLAFAVAYVVVQAALVITAAYRPDRAFGFQMFSEASTIEVHLARVVDTPAGPSQVPVEGGTWVARDRSGDPHRVAWRDRVKDPKLAQLDAPVFATFGADAYLARLQAALDDVARHIPEDAETRALVADVQVRKNGREPTRVQLTSPVPDARR